MAKKDLLCVDLCCCRAKIQLQQEVPHTGIFFIKTEISLHACVCASGEFTTAGERRQHEVVRAISVQEVFVVTLALYCGRDYDFSVAIETETC